MPRGVMHAKVAVVWGDDTLLVAVGSGNLTLPGMQRNLEVWDVLTAGVVGVDPQSVLTRRVADGVSGFLKGLRGRLDPGAWANGPMDEALRALSGWRDDLPDFEEPAWVDSTRESVGDQVVRLLGQAPRHFEWLSPFHDPAGEAVLRLARETGAVRNTLLFSNDTTFPLTAARRNYEVFARQLNVKSGPHHAKVYRWREQARSHILAGSANATRTALWTTDNLEACLLRSGPADAWDGLLASETVDPKERLSPPVVGSNSPLRIASARAGDQGVRVVLAVSGVAPETVSVGYLEHDDQLDCAWTAELTLPFPTAYDPLRPTPLRVQAQMLLDGRVWRARAWVSFDAWLDTSPAYRRSVTQLARLLGAEGGEDEDRIEILNLFAEEHARTLGALGRGVSVSGMSAAARGGADADLPVPVRLLMLAGGGSGHLGGRASAGPVGTVDGVLHAMREAFRALDEGQIGSMRDDDDDETPPASARRVEAGRGLAVAASVAVTDFESRFFKAVSATTMRPAKPEYALAYAAFCMRLGIRLRARASDPTEALLNSLDNWVKALFGPRDAGPPLVVLLGVPVPPSELTGLAAAAIAVLSRRAAARVDPRRPSQRLHTRALREALDVLDRFAPGTAPRAPRELADAMPAETADLQVSLEALRQLPTNRSRMTWIMGTASRLHGRTLKLRDVIDSAAVDPHGALEPDERELLAAAHRGRLPRAALPWAKACPGCHSTLPEETRNRLSARKVQLCGVMRCGRWLVPQEA